MIEITKLKKLLIEKNLQIHGLKPKKQLHYLKKLQQLQKIIILKLFTDRYGKQTASKDKKLIEEWKTIEEIVNCPDISEDKGDKIIHKHYKKKITTDRYGNKTEGEPYFADQNEVTKPAPVVVHHHHHHGGGGGGNFFSKVFRTFGF